MGAGAVSYLTESVHGAGSPQAQRIMIQRITKFDQLKALAREISGL
jgi:4-hydroxybutyryl-CoA dehydratase/vinylacetyl-CoA-Delta-isomerase